MSEQRKSFDYLPLRSLSLRELNDTIDQLVKEVNLAPRWEKYTGYKLLEQVFITRDENDNLWITLNAYYDGTAWLKNDVSLPSFAIQIRSGSGGAILLRSVTAGSINIVSWGKNLEAKVNGLGFFGSPPVARASAIVKLVNSMSSTATDGDLEAIGDTSATDQSAAIERNLSELNAKLDAIIDVLGNTNGVGLTED